MKLYSDLGAVVISDLAKTFERKNGKCKNIRALSDLVFNIFKQCFSRNVLKMVIHLLNTSFRYNENEKFCKIFKK